MRWLYKLPLRFRSLFRKARVERELSDELRFHLEKLAEEKVAQGLAAAEARYAALRELGGVEQIKEACRDTRRVNYIENFIQDIRYGSRQLVHNPSFAAVAVLTLALGIGANTAIFTVINAVMLRMLPVQEPQQLVVIGDPARVHAWSNGTPRTDLFSYPLYCELRDHNGVFSSVLASSHIGSVQLSTDSSVQKVTGRLVTGNYFQTLGVKPLLGRTFTGEEDHAPGSDPVVVISYAYWRQGFSGEPSVIGRVVRLNNYPFTIIGVAPPGFYGEVVGDHADLWIPIMMEPQVMLGRDFLATPDTSTLLLMGRLRPGVTIGQARDNVNVVVMRALTETLSPRLSADDRNAMKGRKFAVEVSPGGRGLSSLREEFSSPLLLLMGLVALVLLVACANVANLMLARAAARRREMAVRLATGAGTGRIVRQLLAEAVLLAGIGGALGLVLAHWGAAALAQVTSRESAITLALGIDWRILAFNAGVCLLAALLFGLAPAMRSVKLNLDAALREGGRGETGRGRWRAGRILIAAQIALGVLVLMAAGLLVRSLHNLQDVDLGYSRDHLVLARVDIVASGYQGREVESVTRELLEGLSSLPGVRSVTASSNGLFSGDESADAIRVEGFTSTRRQDEVTADDEVGPDYFSTIGVPIVLGREINQQDFQTGAHVAVVNETFAKFYFGGRSPLGHAVYIEDSDHPHQPPYEIIGVARDVHDHGVRAAVRRRMYAPLTSATFDDVGAPNFEIRAVGSPRALISGVRQKIHELDANLKADSIETAGDLVSDSLSSQILVAKLSALFGVLVLVLVSVGLYGSMSYRVVERTSEIGVRIALGARRWDVVWMVTREACLILLIGTILGIPGGIATARLFKALLFGVGVSDPVSIAAAIVTLLAVSLAAAIIPARRATKVDPIVALRYE